MTLVKNRVRAARLKKSFGLSAWTNAKTGLSPSGVAQLYAAMHLEGDVAARSKRILQLFQEDPVGAKRLADEVPISEFGDGDQLYHWQQFKALLLKSSGGGLSNADRKSRSIEAFLKAEIRCRRYNRKIAWYCNRPNRMPDNIRVVWSRAREIIRSALGEFTPSRLRDLVYAGYPGSGVAIGTRDRAAVSPPFKYGYTDMCVTRDALPYARMMVESSFARVSCAEPEGDGYRLVYHLVEGNRLSVVPKDATVDRVIAVEPALNVELQLGVHQDWATRVLPKLGVTINDQRSNQGAALYGSIFWEDYDPLVTIDIRNSSGSLSRELIKAFIPDNGWLGYLDDLRSKRYSHDGTMHDYEMWSSMGNGYTFALQCLLYKALAQAAASLTVSDADSFVYGDDIIVHRGVAALLIEVLQFFGVSVNTDKSFLFGPFRESCGADFFGGVDVTPVYLRGIRELRNQDAYRVINFFRSRSHRVSPSLPDLLQARLEGKHPLVPSWFPMDAGIRSHDPYLVYHKWEQGWYTLAIGNRPDSVRHDPLWSYVAALRGAVEVEFRDEFAWSAKKRLGRRTLVATPAACGGLAG